MHAQAHTTSLLKQVHAAVLPESNKKSPSKTETMLSVSADTVSQGTPVTLTATVAGRSAAAVLGQVNFCDATAVYCDSVHLFGTAQITSAGSASYRFIPGMGKHRIKAVFTGTNTNASSQSQTSELTITAAQPTSTAIAQNGSSGDYTLTATVTTEGALAPTGKVDFLNTTKNDHRLAHAELGSAVSTQSFVATNGSFSGVFTEQAATADFNGDGIPDLAVDIIGVGGPGGNITIQLGKGDGSFQTSATLLGGVDPVAVAVGDFNHDGKADLAVTTYDPGNVSICLGNGDATFVCSSVGPTISNPNTPVIVGDFNNDGVQDIVVGGNVLLGNGDGTFQSSVIVPASAFSVITGMVEGDFNGDGLLDLAVMNNTTNSITILAGNGDGTFTPLAPVPTFANSLGIAVGDFNQDGKTDLVIDNDSGALSTLLNNGNGTFTSITDQPLSGDSMSILVADFNGDGVPDIALWNGETAPSSRPTYQIASFLGNGDGTFRTGAAFASPSPGTYLTAGDWNGDGMPDIFASTTAQGTDAEFTIGLSQRSQQAVATATGVAPHHPGENLVEAEYEGDSHYASSVSATTTLTETLASQTINFVQPPSAQVGGTSKLMATASSGLPVTFSIVSGPARLECGKDTVIIYTGKGTVVIAAKQAGDKEYQAAPTVTHTVQVKGSR